ncbi:MAG: ATP-binding protein [Bacillota bacterium]
MQPLAREELERLLRLFVDQSTEQAFVLADPAGKIIWWSPGARLMFGYEPGQIIGQGLEVLFLPRDREKGLAQHEEALARSGDEAEDDRWMRRADGSDFWVTGVLIGIRDEAGELVAFGKVMRDRTDLREQLQAVRNQVVALEQASQRKDAFISTLSHELRNPLAPLVNAVHILRMSGLPSESLEMPVKVIERQIEVLRRLVDDLLDMTRIGAGKILLERTVFDIKTVLAEVMQDAQEMVQAKRHELQLVIPSGQILVEADRERIRQVFVNLVNNAAKHTMPGGKIWIKATIEADEAVVRVEDTGVGIAPDMLTRVFELFTQASSSQALSPGGLGIGLNLVNNLVQLHGGTVQVRSPGLGHGSVFSVRLPLYRDGQVKPAA